MTAAPHRSVPPNTYTRDYYESHCQGYLHFRDSKGQAIPDRLRVPLDLAGISAGMLVLDVGCGRGEIMVQAAQLGAWVVGCDYADAALQIAQQAIASQVEAGRILLHSGNAQSLPYADDRFDRVFLLDVVEHLIPGELQNMLLEVHRVLKPDGCIIIHTMPNTWYYTFGYPLYRFVQRLRGNRLPRNPRDRWGYADVHVNEQNIILLRRELEAAGLRAKVWLQSTQSFDAEPSKLVRAIMRMLVACMPFKLIFCDDIFAIASK